MMMSLNFVSSVVEMDVVMSENVMMETLILEMVAIFLAGLNQVFNAEEVLLILLIYAASTTLLK